MMPSFLRRLIGSRRSFNSPTDFNDFVKEVAQQVRAEGIMQAANRLDEVCSTAYTTSSEWLGDIGLVIRSILAEESPSQDLRARLKTIMEAVHVAWPML
jgi:hypothetical protein